MNNLTDHLRRLKSTSPRDDWKRATREELLLRMQKTHTTDRRTRWHIRTLAATLAIILFLIIPTLTYAHQALPGQPLYPVKRLVESARLTLASSETKHVIQDEITLTRVEEFAQALETDDEKIITAAYEEATDAVDSVAETPETQDASLTNAIDQTLMQIETTAQPKKRRVLIQTLRKKVTSVHTQSDGNAQPSDIVEEPPVIIPTTTPTIAIPTSTPTSTPEANDSSDDTDQDVHNDGDAPTDEGNATPTTQPSPTQEEVLIRMIKRTLQTNTSDTAIDTL